MWRGGGEPYLATEVKSGKLKEGERAGGRKERERQSWMTRLICVSFKHSLVLRGHLVLTAGHQEEEEVQEEVEEGGGSRLSTLQSTVLLAPPQETCRYNGPMKTHNGTISFPSASTKRKTISPSFYELVYKVLLLRKNSRL